MELSWELTELITQRIALTTVIELFTHTLQTLLTTQRGLLAPLMAWEVFLYSPSLDPMMLERLALTITRIVRSM
jgi:hypothetical protein